MPKTNRKYKLNETYFDDINDENKAYILGFICADGYVNIKKGTVRIVLKRSDRDILEKINILLESSCPIKDESRKLKEKSFETSTLFIYSTKICKKLIEYGIDNKKTENLLFPNINLDLQNHFIRGYFDGDGCIKISKMNQPFFSVIGTISFLEKFQEILMENCSLNKTKFTKCGKINNIKYLEYAGKKSCLKIFGYLYNNSTIFLDRKFIRFKEYYNQ